MCATLRNPKIPSSNSKNETKKNFNDQEEQFRVEGNETVSKQ